MIRRISPILLLVAAGCASSPAQLAPSQTPIGTPGARNGVILTREDAVASATLESAADRVWPLVPQVYAEIGLPADQVVPSARMLTTTNVRVRRILGERPGEFLRCPGPYGNAANRDDVYLTVRTQVLPGPGEASTVRIGVSAVSKSTTAANTVTYCSSNGELEKLIAEKLRERLLS